MLDFKWEAFSPKTTCCLDPITLTGLALAGAAGAAGTAIAGGGGGAAAPSPAPPPAQAPPAQAPQAKSKTTSNTPSFLSAAAAPPAPTGQKTLLGQ